jgi:hypothetical protein
MGAYAAVHIFSNSGWAEKKLFQILLIIRNQKKKNMQKKLAAPAPPVHKRQTACALAQ